MNGNWLARGRALLACACLGTITGAASCSTAATGVNITGKTLSIYISAPASLSGDPEAQDVVRAEQLAYQQLHGEVTAYKLELRPALTDDKISGDARTAIEDTTAIAYLGELQPGASADSIGITNAEDLLQVSPTDTDALLTEHSSTSVYYESYGTYGQTFARVVPTTTQEAKAQVAEMRALGVSKVYVTNDGSPYGAAIADAVSQDASGAGISATSGPPNARSALASGSDALFFGADFDSVSQAASLFDTMAETSTEKLFAPSALYDDAFVASLSPAAQRDLYVSSPGFLPGQLTPSGRAFVAAFDAAYGHAPATEAIFGYEAMSALLAVLKEAGAGANSRSTVAGDFLKLKRSSSQSVIGAYSIDKNGDINIAPFVFSRVKSGNLVPVK